MSNISLICGKNEYACWQALQSKKSNYADDIEDIDASEVELLAVQESLQSQSLFSLGGSKMVIIRYLSSNKTIQEYITNNLENIDIDLVIYDPIFDKRTSLFKKLKSDFTVEEFPELNDYELSSWVVDQAKQDGCTISPQDARFLAERVGKNQWLLANELKKLGSYNKQIARDSITLLTEGSAEETVFNILDTLAAGSQNKAVEMVKNFLNQGNEPIYLVSMLIWYFHNFAILRTTNLSSDQDIAKMYKISPFVVSKSKRVASRLSKQDLQEIYQLITQADYELKNINSDRKQLVQILITELSRYFK